MHLDDLLRAGTLVEAVDVLRHDRADPAALLELRDCAVPVVRLRLREHREPVLVEFPHARGIAPERVDVTDLVRIELRPNAVG